MTRAPHNYEGLMGGWQDELDMGGWQDEIDTTPTRTQITRKGATPQLKINTCSEAAARTVAAREGGIRSLQCHHT